MQNTIVDLPNGPEIHKFLNYCFLRNKNKSLTRLDNAHEA